MAFVSAGAGPAVTANPNKDKGNDSIPADYERVKVFRSQASYLEQEINAWLKQMQKDGFRLEITGRLQSSGDSEGRWVNVTIFYKYHYK